MSIIKRNQSDRIPAFLLQSGHIKNEIKYNADEHGQAQPERICFKFHAKQQDAREWTFGDTMLFSETAAPGNHTGTSRSSRCPCLHHREDTGDIREILGMFNDDELDIDHRMKAGAFLVGYGIGRPVQPVEATTDSNVKHIIGVRWLPPDPNDRSRYTPGIGEEEPSAPVIDVQPKQVP